MFLLAFAVHTAAGAPCPTGVSTANVAFGTYTSTTLTTTGTVSFTCPPSQSFTIGLNGGTGSGESVTNRFMTGPGGATLNYGLYTNSTHTSNWGNTSPTWYSGTTITGNDPITVYAQLLGSQYPTAGTYTDTITATITDTTSGNTPGTTTTTFTVTATVQAEGTVSATALAFGTYSGSLIQSTATITVTCTNSTGYTVGLGAGSATGATVTNRMMTGPGGALLHYSLFSNSLYSTNWGNSTGSWVSGTGSGTAQPLTVYGQITASQSPPAGSYSDSVVVTLTY
jgi:spore coat protein U-like protein